MSPECMYSNLVAQKVAAAVLLTKLTLFKIAQKLTNFWNNFEF